MHTLKSLAAALALVLGLLVASVVAPTVAAAHTVGHITCENAGACVVVYYDGYYMARRWNDTVYPTWVRLTYVPFANNNHVAGLQCPYAGESCTIGYSSGAKAWYGIHIGSTYQHRLTLINGS